MFFFLLSSHASHATAVTSFVMLANTGPKEAQDAQKTEIRNKGKKWSKTILTIFSYSIDDNYIFQFFEGHILEVPSTSLQAAARLASAHDFVEHFPAGYDPWLHGANLGLF